jgi:hypothetical protein
LGVLTWLGLSPPPLDVEAVRARAAAEAAYGAPLDANATLASVLEAVPNRGPGRTEGLSLLRARLRALSQRAPALDIALETARVDLETKHFSAARADAEQAFGLATNDRERQTALYLKGLALQRSEDASAAAEAFTAATALGPHGPSGHRLRWRDADQWEPAAGPTLRGPYPTDDAACDAYMASYCEDVRVDHADECECAVDEHLIMVGARDGLSRVGIALGSGGTHVYDVGLVLPARGVQVSVTRWSEHESVLQDVTATRIMRVSVVDTSSPESRTLARWVVACLVDEGLTCSQPIVDRPAVKGPRLRSSPRATHEWAAFEFDGRGNVAVGSTRAVPARFVAVDRLFQAGLYPRDEVFTISAPAQGSR